MMGGKGTVRVTAVVDAGSLLLCACCCCCCCTDHQQCKHAASASAPEQRHALRLCLLLPSLQIGTDADKQPPPPTVLKPLSRCSASSELMVGQKARQHSVHQMRSNVRYCTLHALLTAGGSRGAYIHTYMHAHNMACHNSSLECVCVCACCSIELDQHDRAPSPSPLLPSPHTRGVIHLMHTRRCMPSATPLA